MGARRATHVPKITQAQQDLLAYVRQEGEWTIPHYRKATLRSIHALIEKGFLVGERRAGGGLRVRIRGLGE